MSLTSRVAAAAAVSLVLTTVGVQPAAAATDSSQVVIARSSDNSATVAFDLAELPDNAVLIVERRLGPKSPYVEVDRTGRTAGVIAVYLPSLSKVSVRATVVGSRGSVLVRAEVTL